MISEMMKKQHPEHLGLDPRAAVGGRGTVVVMVTVRRWRGRLRRGLHQAGRRLQRRRRRSTGARPPVTRVDEVGRSQPDASRQRGDDDVVDREQSSAFMIACRGRGRRSCRWRDPSAQRAEELQALARAGGLPVAALLRDDRDEDAVLVRVALALEQRDSSSLPAVRLATTSVTWTARPSRRRR
jgi:hypothetical protein